MGVGEEDREELLFGDLGRPLLAKPMPVSSSILEDDLEASFLDRRPAMLIDTRCCNVLQ